jgi:CheY-like chemotaxis protein
LARILVTEDEEIVRKAILTVLRRGGHDVVEAVTGEEALRLYREHSTDLVIVDIVLPGIDGLQVIQELRREHDRVKIIAVTGVRPESLTEAERLGAVKTFSKPFDIQEFLDAVGELLGEPADE